MIFIETPSLGWVYDIIHQSWQDLKFSTEKQHPPYHPPIPIKPELPWEKLLRRDRLTKVLTVVFRTPSWLPVLLASGVLQKNTNFVLLWQIHSVTVWPNNNTLHCVTLKTTTTTTTKNSLTKYHYVTNTQHCVSEWQLHIASVWQIHSTVSVHDDHALSHCVMETKQVSSVWHMCTF